MNLKEKAYIERECNKECDALTNILAASLTSATVLVNKYANKEDDEHPLELKYCDLIFCIIRKSIHALSIAIKDFNENKCIKYFIDAINQNFDDDNEKKDKINVVSISSKEEFESFMKDEKVPNSVKIKLVEMLDSLDENKPKRVIN